MNPLLATFESLYRLGVDVGNWRRRRQQIVARIADRRAVTSDTARPIRATVGDTQYEARRIFREWARQLRSLLDAVKTTDLAES